MAVGLGGQADGGEMAFDARRIVRRAEAEARRKVEGHHHADGHGLAMQQLVCIAAFGLQRMAEGVAEIEQRAGAGLALVLADDARPWRRS